MSPHHFSAKGMVDTGASWIDRIDYGQSHDRKAVLKTTPAPPFF
jgi:hypothetical protein